jgi:GT2 family glycosyltransferase
MNNKNQQLFIIIPTMCNYEGLVTLINSIYTKTKIHNLYIHNNITDNGGVSRAWNEGIKLGLSKGYTEFLVLSDDIILLDDIDNLVQEFHRLQKEEDYLILSGRRIIDGMMNINTQEGATKLTGCDFACFAFSKKLIDKIGYFDEKFYPAYFEDNDMDYRIKLAKYHSGSSPLLRFVTRGSVTLEILGDTDKGKQIKEGFVRNKEYYLKKWGGIPSQETFITPFNK